MYKSKKASMEERKPDTGKNENENSLEALIERQWQMEKKLHLIRVSRNTWILVPKKKANRAYAEQYQKDHVSIRRLRGTAGSLRYSKND